MSKLRLTLACTNYDRVRPIEDGRVQPLGIDLIYLRLHSQAIFLRMLKYHEFDVAELSFAKYVLSLFEENPPFIAIPAFPSRMFRHAAIYVSRKSGIRNPKDLVGKRVGVPEYDQTAGVWIRGMLAEEYNVPVASVNYHAGRVKDEKYEGTHYTNLSSLDVVPNKPGIRVEPIGKGKNLSQMLMDDEIDAIYSAGAPPSFVDNPESVERLFPNCKKVEEDYFRKTRIFPIMHVFAIKKEVYDQNRWIAKSLYDAFLKAKQLALDELLNSNGVCLYMLPWLHEEIDSTTNVMGKDYWPYGISANEKTVGRFLTYLFDQGLIPRKREPREIFAAETIAT